MFLNNLQRVEITVEAREMNSFIYFPDFNLIFSFFLFKLFYFYCNWSNDTGYRKMSSKINRWFKYMQFIFKRISLCSPVHFTYDSFKASSTLVHELCLFFSLFRDFAYSNDCSAVIANILNNDIFMIIVKDCWVFTRVKWHVNFINK